MEVGERIVGAQVVTIPRGGEVRDLPPAGIDPVEVAALPVRTDQWGDTTVEGVLARSQARSLVVLHDGRIAYEWYGPSGDRDRRNRCYSVTKSFTGTLAAVAMHEGRLDRSATIGDLLPELAASGFGDATVGDVADMTVSMGYDEDYADAGEAPSGEPTLGFGDYMLALGLELPDAVVPDDAPRSIRDFLRSVRPGNGPHGQTFLYATPCTDVLGWLLEQAGDASYPDLLAESIWARIGAEHDARLALDPAGTPTAGAGLAVTTRDLARFGLMLCEQGRTARPGDEVVPSSVIEDIRDGGDREVFLRGGHYDYLTGYSYHDQWWLPGGPDRPLSAWGIHGQVLWVDPDVRIVVATHCGGPDPSDQRRDLEQDAMCRALTEASLGWT
ncbi:MAG: serine hydrolase domain-containing protein [Acidimicrobiales bacterium]